MIQGYTDFHVRFRPGLLKKPVYLRVGIAGMVVGAFTVEQYVQKVLGIWIVRHPSQGEHLVSPPVQVVQEGGELGLLYLHIHSQEPPPHLQDYFCIQPHGAATARHRKYYGGQVGCRLSGGLAQKKDALIGVTGHVGLQQQFRDLGITLPVAGLCHEPHRLLRIVVQALQILVEAREARGQDAVGRCYQVGEDRVGDKLLVDCQV